MRALVPLVAVLALAAVAAPASAETFRGETAQGRPVTVETGPDGAPSLVRIRWHAPCAQTSGRYQERTDFQPPLDLTTPDRVRDAGVTRLRQDEPRARITEHLRMRGARTANGWSGTFSGRAVVRRDGKRIDTCTVRGLRWSATRAGARAAARTGFPALATSQGRIAPGTSTRFRDDVRMTMRWLAAHRDALEPGTATSINTPSCTRGRVGGLVDAIAAPPSIDRPARRAVDCTTPRRAFRHDVAAFRHGFAPVTRLPLEPRAARR